jgi:hypothetical protein
MRKSLFPILIVALSAPAAALAAGITKPGLWQMTMKSDAMKNMPKLPPEQLEQMKKMGITLPQMQDGAMVTKVCISKEMAARDEPPAMAAQSGCQPKNYQRSGSTYSVDIVCNGAEIKGQGKARGTITGDNFTSTYDFQGTMHGQPVNQHHETSGKWLGADCGDVKPIGDMMPKK